MTLTPLLKELKDKAEKYQNSDESRIWYEEEGELESAYKSIATTENILFLIQAIEEMKEALQLASIENFSQREKSFNAKEVLQKYFGVK